MSKQVPPAGAGHRPAPTPFLDANRRATVPGVPPVTVNVVGPPVVNAVLLRKKELFSKTAPSAAPARSRSVDPHPASISEATHGSVARFNIVPPQQAESGLLHTNFTTVTA